MQYRSTNPKGKARGMSASILHTKRGIGQLFSSPLLISMDTINMFLAPKNCMSVCPGPQELYNSKYMDTSPTRRDCITYTVPFIP